jgi:hypothetical protein
MGIICTPKTKSYKKNDEVDNKTSENSMFTNKKIGELTFGPHALISLIYGTPNTIYHRPLRPTFRRCPALPNHSKHSKFLRVITRLRIGCKQGARLYLEVAEYL